MSKHVENWERLGRGLELMRSFTLKGHDPEMSTSSKTGRSPIHVQFIITVKISDPGLRGAAVNEAQHLGLNVSRQDNVLVIS